MQSVDSMKASVRNYTKGNYYRKQYIQDPKVGLSTSYIIFKRPRRMLFKITEAPNSPSLINTKLYSDGGSNVKIKVPGILGLFTFTFPVDKPELTGYRGYSIQDVDPVSIENRLNNKDAKVKLLGTSMINNEEAYMLEVTNIKFLDDKITKEVLGIRKKDYSLLLHEMYDANEVVFQNKFEGALYNVPVSEDDFKI